MNYTAPDRSTILVMQHDPLLRAGLVAALRDHPAFEIYVDDADAVSPDHPEIDVVIADYSQAMRLADSAVRATRRPLAAARIMALTSNDREADIRRAIEAGVQGYLLLGGPLSELIEGVTTVANGVRYLGRSVAQRMADSLTRTSLTSRELEVLQLVVAGESNKAIARELRIELGTVKSHMTAIMTKLNATSRTQAAGIASDRGLVKERALVRPVPHAALMGLMASRMQHSR
jgi:DNA-binding NarL/FixJ family response regulator